MNELEAQREIKAEAAAIAPRRQTLFELDEHLMLLLEHRDALLDEQADVDRGYHDRSLDDGEYEAAKRDIGGLLAGVEEDIQKYSLALSKKVDGCAGVLRELEALTQLRKAEGERILAMAKQSERAHDYLEGVILATMQAQKVKFYQGKTSRLTCAGNGGLKPLVITEPDAIPLECKQYTIKLAADAVPDFAVQFAGRYRIVGELAEPYNAEIRSRLDAGEKVEGAHLADRGVHLLVK